MLVDMSAIFSRGVLNKRKKTMRQKSSVTATQ